MSGLRRPRRGLPARAGLTLAAVMLGVASAAPAGSQDGPHHVARAFSAEANATPVEPAPGVNETEVAFRPAATTARAFNPPVAAFGRAAAVDLGLAEALIGPAVDEAGAGDASPPSADVDTQVEGSNDKTVDEGGTHLEARADESPMAVAAAEGSSGGPTGSATSRSFADGSGETIVAVSEAEISDATFGPLVIGSGRFDGRAQIDGTPGGGSARGVITVTGATFADVPVVIDDDGMAVDETRVPAPLVGEATAAIQEFFSPGGFADIRVVQPKVEVAEDGRSATVNGGGVRVFMSSNDPANNYFFAATFLRGSAEVFMGSDLSVAAPDPVGSAAPDAPAATPNRADAPADDGRPVSPPTTQVRTSPPSEEELAVETVSGRTVLEFRGPWPHWPWLVAGIAALWLGAGALRLPPLRRVRRWVEAGTSSMAERFLRG